MADIELVIKIPEYFYEYCKAQTDAIEIQLAVANGTPLPKGHGGMIDIDALLSNIEVKAFLSQDDMHLVTIGRVKEAIDTAPIIVESDKIGETNDYNNREP